MCLYAICIYIYFYINEANNEQWGKNPDSELKSPTDFSSLSSFSNWNLEAILRGKMEVEKMGSSTEQKKTQIYIEQNITGQGSYQGIV